MIKFFAAVIFVVLIVLSGATNASVRLASHGAPGAVTTPVITFNPPSASYVYPSASGTTLTTVTATTNVGSFLGGGGTFTTSNCPASNIAVASGGSVTVAGPSNLTGNQSCTITANYPGATSVPQAFTLTGIQQTIASITPPCSLGGGCSYSFTAPVTSLTLAAVPTVTMSGGISFSAGGGTIVLGTGLQCSNFALSGGNLQITASTNGSYACTYVITDSNASNSPQTPGITASSGSTTNVISVQLGNENIKPSASIGTVVGALSAKVTGGGTCTTCTFTMVNSGASSDGSLPISCSTSSNDFQVITSGPDPVDLANLNVISTAQVYGQVGDISPTHSYICVKATPAVGSSWTQPFSIMVRNPTFTAFGPLFVQYTTGVGKSVPLATTICWADCGGVGSPPTVTYVLGTDAACTAPGISISGSNLVFSSSYTVPNAGSGGANCHITATAAGVAAGMIGTGGSNFVADVHISQGAYVGPGDATYPNGATGMTWTNFTGPYAISAAYATAGSPIWYVQREGDGQFFTINALANGDMDYNTLASDCDPSICYLNLSYDQSGNSPGCTVSAPANCMPTWGAANGAGITTRKPVVYFDAFDGARVAGTNANSFDRGMWNPTAYNGSGATGTLWIVPAENSGLFGGPAIEMNDSGTGSAQALQLSFTNGGGATLYVGPDSHVGGTQMAAAATGTSLHSMIGVVNGASSVLKVDGAETTVTTGTLASPVSGSTSGTLTAVTALPSGVYSATDSMSQLTSGTLVTVTNGSAAITFSASQTLSSGDVLTLGALATASLIKPLGFGMTYGGGSIQGFIGGPAAISSTIASTSQRQALCLFDQWTYGIGGTC